MRFVGGTESDLMKSPFLGFDLMSSDGGSGHVGFIFHKQPELERAVRDAISTTPCSDLRPKSLLVSVAQEGSTVKADYIDRQGLTRQIRAPFLVGADGKTGYVRKRYLEPRGISLERCKGCVLCLPT